MRAYKFLILLLIVCFWAMRGFPAHATCGCCPGDAQPPASAPAQTPAGSSAPSETATVPSTQSTAGLDSPAQRLPGGPDLPPISAGSQTGLPDADAISRTMEDIYGQSPEFGGAADGALRQVQSQVGDAILTDHTVERNYATEIERTAIHDYKFIEVPASSGDRPLFVTYLDSVFAGATSDMVQFKYAWLVSENDAGKDNAFKDIKFKDPLIDSFVIIVGGPAETQFDGPDMYRVYEKPSPFEGFYYGLKDIRAPQHQQSQSQTGDSIRVDRSLPASGGAAQQNKR